MSLEGKGVSRVSMAMAAIAAYHERFDLPSPTRSPGVLAMVKGYKKSKGRAPVQAKAMSKRVLKKLIRKALKDSLLPVGKKVKDLSLWRAAWLESTAFATLSRFLDLQRLKRKDIVVKSNMVIIKFDSKKNDSTHKGHWSYLFAVGGEFCPVRLTRMYLKMLPVDEEGFLLHALKHGAVLRSAATNGACRKAQFNLLKDIGEDPTIYGLHSG
jgi:integrase